MKTYSTLGVTVIAYKILDGDPDQKINIFGDQGVDEMVILDVSLSSYCSTSRGLWPITVSCQRLWGNSERLYIKD
jgi:imidazole glycerol phosphate synthase subunit HisF